MVVRKATDVALVLVSITHERHSMLRTKNPARRRCNHKEEEKDAVLTKPGIIIVECTSGLTLGKAKGLFC